MQRKKAVTQLNEAEAKVQEAKQITNEAISEVKEATNLKVRIFDENFHLVVFAGHYLFCATSTDFFIYQFAEASFHTSTERGDEVELRATVCWIRLS